MGICQMNTAFLKRKGFILFSVLCFILVLMIIMVPLLSWSISEFSWTRRSFSSLSALNLADAGAESAIWQIVYNNAQFTEWSGTNPKTITLQSFTDNTGRAVGDISVSAESTSPDHYIITSTGFVPDMTSPLTSKTVKVKVFPHAIFNNGIFGSDSVTLTGNTLVDSYDSEDAPYSPATAEDNGDVGTNGTLTLLENTSISGDAFISSGGSILIDPTTSLSGEIYYSGGEVELEPIAFPDDLAALSSGGNWLISKDNLSMASGNYRYESITVEGQGALTLNDNVRLYIHNDFSVAGQATVFTNNNVEIYIGGNGNFAGQGMVNTTGVPDNLIMYGLGADTALNFTGLNDFSGCVYAPESSVYMSGEAGYFGSVIAGDVTLAGNIKFHFDENLLSDGPSIGYDIAYWQED